MGKPATPRHLAETEAKMERSQRILSAGAALVIAIITAPAAVAQKPGGILNISHFDSPASVSLHELAFSRKRIARDVRKVLQSAIANAENNHQLDVDRLVVKEASVGRAFTLSRFHTRGRGRVAHIEKYFSNLTVVVREREEEKA